MSTETPAEGRTPDRLWDAAVSVTSLVVDRLEPLLHAQAMARATSAMIGLEGLIRSGVDVPRRVMGSLGIAGLDELDALREDLEALRASVDPRAEVRSSRPAPVNWREGGQGPPLLLLNGWSASGLVWSSSFLEVLQRRYRVIRPDNRGTGWSRSAPAPFTIADLADDAAAVLREARAPTATVLGLSMGGMIAQELAVRHPDVVDRLVVVASRPPAPAFVTAGPGFFGETLRTSAGGRASAHLAQLWGNYCAPGFAEAHPELIDELVGQILRRPTPRMMLLQQMRSMAAWWGPDRLAAIEAPTMVVHGAEDPLMPVANGMRIARLIPGAAYHEFEHVGHLVSVEAGERLADVLEDVPAAAARPRAVAAEGETAS